MPYMIYLLRLALQLWHSLKALFFSKGCMPLKKSKMYRKFTGYLFIELYFDVKNSRRIFL